MTPEASSRDDDASSYQVVVIITRFEKYIYCKEKSVTGSDFCI